MRTRFISVVALMLLVFGSPLAVKSANKAYCSADCGAAGSLTCTAGSCTAVDQNCSIGERGYLTCGTSTTYCPSMCPAEDCSANSICNANCPDDPDCGVYSYNPCDPGPNPLTGCYYNWSPQTLCCVAVDPGSGCQNICF